MQNDLEFQMRNLLARLPVLLFLIAAEHAVAGSIPNPTGNVVLKVEGSIGNSNASSGAQFDRATLDTLGRHSIRTSTSWTDGVPTFEGVHLADVLKQVAASGKTIIATALNDYSVKIPVSDATKYNVLLADTMNGKTLSRRDKGPLWIVYPRDEHPELQTESYNDRWIWQLVKLEIR